jgi:hypothetical protein
MPRVLTMCPNTGQTVPTHAVLTADAFKRLKVGMAIYCPACGRSHLAERRRLWLENPDQPLGQPPAEVARELDAPQNKRDSSSGDALLL